MGKVFSPAEVQNGAVPAPYAHESAAAEILQAARDAHVGEYDFVHTRSALSKISGVMIYGSTATGTANIRSDLDVLVAYDNSVKAIDQAHELFKEVSHRWRVPVEANAQPWLAIESPLRNGLDIAFASHLKHIAADDRWRAGNPTADLRVDVDRETYEAFLLPATVKYLASKRKKFAHELMEVSDEPDLKVMQRALELPTAVARKILSLKEPPEIADKADNKQAAVAYCHQIMIDLRPGTTFFENEDEAGNFMELVAANAEYSEALDATVTGALSIGDYELWLNDHYRVSLQRAHNVALYWERAMLNLFENRFSWHEGVGFEARLLGSNFQEGDY